VDLTNRVALVTGAGRGIGRALSLMLAAEGCAVAAAARSTDELDSLVAEIETGGAAAAAFPADLAKMDEARDLVGRVIDRFGRLEILINNAGIAPATPFLEITEEEFDLTMNVNLKSMLILCQAALRAMKESGTGHIVNVSSTVALGVPALLGSYGISKHGVVGLSQALYQTAKQLQVKVSVVYPGITDTKMVRDLEPPTKPEQWMRPEDIAETILFLLKQSNRAIVRDLVPWSTGYDRI